MGSETGAVARVVPATSREQEEFELTSSESSLLDDVFGQRTV